MVAKRVATMCFSKFSHGSNADVCKFREELLQSYRGDLQDVSPESEAWEFCRTQLTHENPVVAFHFEDKAGKKLPFQTTAIAAGGSILHAERIARLCWEKLKSGMKKDAVIEYRNRLYEKIVDSGSSKQKQEQSGTAALPTKHSGTGEQSRSRAEHFIALDKEHKCYSFEYPMEGKKIKFQVALKALGNNSMVAKRVATMCFSKFSHGSSNADVCKFRDELLQSYRGDVQDVSPDSEAWQFCRTQLTHENPVVPFQFEDKAGKKLPFQTTVRAAGGSILHAERIARLCWEKLKSGVKKDEVIEYRKRLYEKIVDSGNSKQKQEQSGCGKRALSASAVATPQKRCRLSA